MWRGGAWLLVHASASSRGYLRETCAALPVIMIRVVAVTVPDRRAIGVSLHTMSCDVGQGNSSSTMTTSTHGYSDFHFPPKIPGRKIGPNLKEFGQATSKLRGGAMVWYGAFSMVREMKVETTVSEEGHVITPSWKTPI